MGISKEAARPFAADYRAVFDAVCAAVHAEGMRVAFADPATGFVQVSSDVSLLSWGENATIQVGADPSGTTWVTVRSSLKFGLVDWGRNQQNIDRLFNRIGALLQGPQAGAWHPDPTARHELRWWDGNAWTPHVSDGGATSVDPL